MRHDMAGGGRRYFHYWTLYLLCGEQKREEAAQWKHNLTRDLQKTCLSNIGGAQPPRLSMPTAYQ